MATAETHEQITQRIGGYLTGALTANLIYIGDQLGLYNGLKELGKATSTELAQSLGLSERWVREWLYQQASAQLITTDDNAEYFHMTKPQEDALANELGPDASPYFMGGMPQVLIPCFAANPQLLEAFKTGLGLKYDEYGGELAVGVSRHLNVWTRHFLVEKFSSLPGVKDKLEAGAMVADVGCGCGEALVTLAKAFPNSTFHGYDNSKVALEKSAERLKDLGLENVSFFNPEETPMPTTGAYDFIYTLDAIHDMAHPDRVIKAVRGAVKDDGSYLICDFYSKDTPAENIKENADMSAMFHGYSVHICMSSALSDGEHSMGLGTLGLTERVAERLTSEAGFSKFQKVDFDRPEMAFYLVEP